jgi:hypothetical protein
MKFLTLLSALLATAGLLPAQSNPSWWKYAPPEASSIVGIQWKTVQTTIFAPAVAAELAPGGSFRFPDMEMLRTPEQLLVASPSMMAIEYGTFPLAKLRTEAAEKGLKKVSNKGGELWISSDPAVNSVAYISEKLLLVGSQKSLEDAMNRIANTKERTYSPLLSRGARYSKEDIWVVSSRLPDPLASLFLPLDIEATAFEGSLSVWDGLHLVAAVERATPMKALDFADALAENLASRPAMAEATEISTRDRSVLIRMDLDELQLAASLRKPTSGVTAATDPHEAASLAVSAPTPAPAPAPVAAKPQPKAFVPPAAAPVRAPQPAPATLVVTALPESALADQPMVGSPQAMLPPAPPRPKMIKIIGLDSGVKEIPLGQH